MTATSTTDSTEVRWGMLGTLPWAIVLGAVSAMSCVAVRYAMRGLQWLITQHADALPMAAASLSGERRFATPIVGAVLAATILQLSWRWNRGHPFEEYVEAVRYKDGEIPFASSLWRTLSAMFSIASGAAVGREGAMIQFAATMSSWLGSFRLGQPSLSRKVSYGVAAAVAAAYMAPCAGVLFAYELVLGEFSWADCVPLCLASATGWFVPHLLFRSNTLLPVDAGSGASLDIARGFVLAIALAILAPLYQRLFEAMRITSKLRYSLVWSAVLVGLLSLLEPCVWGNGDVALTRVLGGSLSLISALVLLLLRVTATSVCIGSGTTGGLFTPTLFTGAAMGWIVGHLSGSTEPVFLAVVGMAAFLAAVTHAPLTATAMAVELTGNCHLLPLLLLYNLLAWAVTRKFSNRSLYAIATPTPLEPGSAAA